MTKKITSTDQTPSTGCSRRGFLAGATAVGLTILKPELVRGTQANSKITLGLIGSGTRGSWIANLFQKHGGYQFVATDDYFANRAQETAIDLKVPAEHAFGGLDGYKRLLALKPDAVVIESTPYFHPEQAKAGVDAGCHVYCAEPMAVDVPGCLSIAETGRKGTENRHCVLIDFQTRADQFYKEAVRRVHAGDIGRLVNGEAVYYTGGGSGKINLQDPEDRIRRWPLDRILSGDVITEQNIHALDVATWIIDQHPLQAYGTCAKTGRMDNGTCNDHFAVIFTFPNEVVVSFTSKQYGTGFEDIGCRMFGPDGMIDTHYGGITHIVGKKSYVGGKSITIYEAGAVSNIATFHDNISKGDFSNATVAPSVRSNLTTILGRMAAYKKTVVTWDEMLKTAEKLDFPMAGLKV